MFPIRYQLNIHSETNCWIIIQEKSQTWDLLVRNYFSGFRGKSFSFCCSRLHLATSDLIIFIQLEQIANIKMLIIYEKTEILAEKMMIYREYFYQTFLEKYFFTE